MKDVRRLNVAITRARHGLYIVGHEPSLMRSSDWSALLKDARARGLARDVSLATALKMSPRDLLNSVIPITLLDGSPLEAYSQP